MKKYKSRMKELKFNEVEEKEKSVKAIKDLIALDWSKDEEAQHTALALIGGLVHADNDVADKFIKKLSDFTSTLNAEDYN